MTASGPITSFLTFAAGQDSYAIPLARIREVVGCRTVVPVPNAGEFLRGLMNLRGSVVPVIDLGRRLGAGETALSSTSCAVLLETDVGGEQTAVAGLVEEVRSVIEIREEAVANPPDFGTPVEARLLRGVTAEGAHCVYLLDPDQIFAGIA